MCGIWQILWCDVTQCMQIAACWNVLWTTLRNSSLSSSRSFHWKDLKNLKPWILWLFVTVTHLMLAAPWSCEAMLPERRSGSGPGCREAVKSRRSSGSRVDPLVIRSFQEVSSHFLTSPIWIQAFHVLTLFVLICWYCFGRFPRV